MLRPLTLLFLAAALACAPDRAPPPGDRGLDSAQTEPPGIVAAGPAIQLDRAAAAIRSAVQAGRAPILERGGIASQRQEISRLYDETFAPLWVDVAGHPTQASHDAIAAMHTALEDGLDTLDYSAARLDSAGTALDRRLPPAAEDVARFDLALSTAFLRYIGDLHAGRIDPRRIGFQLDLPIDRHDIPALVRNALADGTVPQLALTQRPPLVQYTRARDVLARYRVLADSLTDRVPGVTTSVKPGDAWAGVPSLADRLRLLGDLVDTVAIDSGRYTPPLADAVKRFQDRHGLEPDGVIGRATIAALNTPLAQRVAQLELTLERLRWIPDLSGERFLVVNIPTFHLWGWDSLNVEGVPSIDMNVIVGQKALDTRTPVFIEQMRYVIFRPYWNVPPSILRNEVLPEIRKDSTYLARNDMEIVQGMGDDARPVAPSPENLALLGRGQLRVRQRPGPRNSLGLVKFMFPNDENVYLHGTPAQELFSRTRRDFSHGCVRVERPVDLAEWALRGLPRWTRDSIIATMALGKPTRVNLAQPISVVLFYSTAIVGLDGTPMFFEDIYGHDERLLQALGARAE